MKEKLRQFMIGRYGPDQLGQFLIGMAMVLLLLDFFTGNLFVSLLSVLILGYCYFRICSRNAEKRYRENQIYLGLLSQAREMVGRQRFKVKDRRTNHVYKCPGCRQKIRVPKGKGKISIHCPKCGDDFVRKS